MRTRTAGLALLALASCGKAASAPREPEPATLEDVPASHPALAPLPDPDEQGGHVGRAPRRLTVAQLGASIELTTGRPWDKLDKLAASLGEADYALVNAESAEPNLVYAKFLEDGAREVCLATADADLAQKDLSARVLSPNLPDGPLTALAEAAVRDNLVYLSTRFWGQPLSGAELDTWLRAFQGFATRAEAAKKRREAWGAVCIGLLTDPRFSTY